jgi:hypothetical protein
MMIVLLNNWRHPECSRFSGGGRDLAPSAPVLNSPDAPPLEGEVKE